MTYPEACAVKTKEEADAAIEELTQRSMKHGLLNYGEARAIQLSNIGYAFGDLSREERIRAMELYPEAIHPIFGRHVDVPPGAAFNAGMALGQGKGILAARKIIDDAITPPPD